MELAKGWLQPLQSAHEDRLREGLLGLGALLVFGFPGKAGFVRSEQLKAGS